MKQLFWLFAFFLFLNISARSQPSPNSSGALLHALQKWKQAGSVLYIAAHPDDENTRLLAYLAGERKLRTAYLSLTRGDGGQNLIGNEQGEMLGLIRTQELLEARKIDGAEQFFTRAVDFGFSKNPEETFEHWNKDSVLADVVWIIRNFKPDVIITRFPATGEGGHGHHTASAILAQQAFEDAADPGKFPEQLKYVQPWKTKRLFWNTFNFGGGRNTISEDQLKINVGIFSPLRGKYYGEIAAESRSMHKSQGFGAAATRGESFEYFSQLKGDIVKNDLFENILLDWSRFPQAGDLNKIIEKVADDFDVLAPEKSVDALLEIDKKLQNLNAADEHFLQIKKQKLSELEDIIAACAGVWAAAYAEDFIAVPGEKININAQIVAHGGIPVALSFAGKEDFYLERNKLYRLQTAQNLSSSQNYSDPFWLKLPAKNGLYSVEDKKDLLHPENLPPLMMPFHLKIKDRSFTLLRPAVYRYVDPVDGEQQRPLEILPAATVNFDKEMLLFTDKNPQTIHAVIRANKNNVVGKLSLSVPAGWKTEIAQPDFKLNKNEEAVMAIRIHSSMQSAEQNLRASIATKDGSFSKQIKRINHDHISPQIILKDAEVKLVNINLKKSGANIGYIPGAGDDVAELLSRIGYKVTMLDNAALALMDLSAFDAIVTGVRAYNVNEKMQSHYNKLMNYVKNGGNLVVQYNTNSGLGPLLSKIGPYDFTISRNRVTDENAEVNFILPEHPVLNFPNKITEKDFEGWVQERGIYFVSEKSDQYATPLAMRDKNEPAQTGSIIVAPFGKGNFVYTGLSFFRQLPAGNTGAFKLFVNLLSIPKR